jgi:[phosphatase 2A protein]-leucine-carboxy methyltransferase
LIRFSTKFCFDLIQKITNNLIEIKQKTDPVLFVFECVLLYWSSEDTNALIYSLNHWFSRAEYVVFDVVNTDDKFAHLMQESLCEMDTPLLGVTSSVTLDDWNSKFKTNGCKEVVGWDMNTVYETLLARDDRYRIEKIEFLDEIELLTQLLSHYCLIIASNYCEVNYFSH